MNGEVILCHPKYLIKSKKDRSKSKNSKEKPIEVNKYESSESEA